MAWNYRVVKKKLTEDEDTFDVCEVYYDDKGKPTSYALNKNVLSQDSFDDLLWAYKEIEKAYNAPILEDIAGQLIEISNCPKCGEELVYDVMDIMGDGKEEDFGKTAVVCPQPNGCGYVAIRQDYTKKQLKAKC
ncbi:hypothetical protein bcgnr5372_26180 [Bacillus luti]|nr:hypothetical protein [Bacillus cereus]HDR8329409.1 hypothetical protein [Bacillus cereus]HDR8335987.1 hypothetical protein [Bacillus cereus]